MPSSRKALTRFDDYYDMMSDAVRMGAYEEAIAKVVRPGDVVVDLGAGLGILSLLAARAGARRVYAIEKGDSIELAREVARLARLDDRIEFVAESSLDCELPEPADVLLSETLGSFAIDENTLEFTIDARKRMLAPHARFLPAKLRLFLAPVEHERGHERLSFWRNVAGFDYAPAVAEILGRMSLAEIEPDALLGKAVEVARIDLSTVDSPQIEASLRFEIERGGNIHGLAGWFEAHLASEVAIATSPADPATHWKQAFFPFREPVRVVPGDVLSVKFRMGPRGDRSDNTTVSYEYFCTQTASENAGRGKPHKRAPCPCGSGKTYARCCGRTR